MQLSFARVYCDVFVFCINCIFIAPIPVTCVFVLVCFDCRCLSCLSTRSNETQHLDIILVVSRHGGSFYLPACCGGKLVSV